jgi:streptogramin lyase
MILRYAGAVLIVMLVGCTSVVSPTSTSRTDSPSPLNGPTVPMRRGFTTYTVPTLHAGPNGVAVGSDGNVWFTEWSGGNIGRITPTGVITEFPDGYAQTNGIAPGQSGMLWFTYSIIDNPSNIVGMITTTGQITTFPTPAGGCPDGGIVLGSDGNMWFPDLCRSTIDRILPDGTVTEFPTPTVGGPLDIAAGPDGNVWYVDSNSDHGIVGRVTMSGIITEFPLPSGVFPNLIIAGDRQFLYTGSFKALIRVSTSGKFTTFPVASISNVYAMALFPKGIIWMAGLAGIATFDVRTHVSSAATQIPGNGRGRCCPRGIADGPDHDPWFSASGPNYIGVYK